MAKSKKKSGASQTSNKPVTTTPSTNTPAVKPTAGLGRTKERREERRQQERRQRNTFIVIAVIAVVVIFGGIFLVVNLPQEAPIPDGTDTRYAGIPQSYSIENNMPILGDPNAPVQVVSYTSFACPACKDFHNAMADTMIELIRAGIMSYTIIPQENGEIANGNGAARAALCAADQIKFFEYADVLFNWQEVFGNQAFPQNRLFAGGEALGLNGDTFRSCLAGGRSRDLYNISQDLRIRNNITGTPRTFINGIEYTGSLTDRNAFRGTVQQSYQQTGRIAVPLPTQVPDVPEQPSVETTPEVEMTPEATPEVTPEATPAS